MGRPAGKEANSVAPRRLAMKNSFSKLQRLHIEPFGSISEILRVSRATRGEYERDIRDSRRIIKAR